MSREDIDDWDDDATFEPPPARNHQTVKEKNNMGSWNVNYIIFI